ncbi:MAG TPA: hypothetical protein IAB27_02385 [Candidatus Coprosoma intestinipullorum]|uniref:Uncharacterized protein n=1 Tax=Candidatus Coprosoma intestinipullorum TaxID=2840752 RepID=A0A9D0ZQ64_9FIRM|nr:hypothetical protein [Candidatus Coprosoma intestinipullorum]
MKKIIIVGIFILGMILPNINVKAVDVANEEELRTAIEQGGDITLTKDIEVTQPLVIDKDVNIHSDNWRYIMMQGDNTLMTVNSGNVAIDENIGLFAGWNGEYNEYDEPDNVVKGQGTALVVNGGNVYGIWLVTCGGKVGMIINGGNVRTSGYIKAGVYNENNDTYSSGGNALIINGGSFVKGNELHLLSGGTALTLNKGSNITLNCEDSYSIIGSFEENGIEVNDGSVVNINSSKRLFIFGSQNAIYLNGGTANLNGKFGLSSSDTGHGIYINKGINTNTKGDVLNLKNNSIFMYGESTSNFSIYVNPEIAVVKVIDEKNFFSFEDNKLKLDFCSNYSSAANTDSEEGPKICNNLSSYYDGPIESNELGKCMVVYINGEKQNEVDASCNPVSEEGNNNPQVVEVPATSAYGSLIIATLGIICVIVSIIVTRKVIKKAN